MPDLEMTGEYRYPEYYALRDAIDAASDQDQITWLTHDGKRIAAIVPVDVAEAHEADMEAVLAAPVGNAVDYGTGLKLIDTPQWAALSVAERRMVGLIYGNDTGGGYKATLSTGARKVAEALEAKGLVTVTRSKRYVLLSLRMAGWSQ